MNRQLTLGSSWPPGGTPTFVQLPSPDLLEIYADEPRNTLWDVSLNASIVTDNAFSESTVDMVVHGSPYSLSPFIKYLELPFVSFLQKHFPHKRLSNGTTVRLQQIEFRDNRVMLHIQSATYYQYLVTGWAASQNYGIIIGDNNSVSIRDLVEPGPSLAELPTAIPSNHIGLNVMLLWGDHLLMRKRSRKVLTDSGLLDLSVSGVLEFNGSKTSVFREVFREVEEELGISGHELEVDDLTLIGISREFERAGKPEFYFCLRSQRPRVSVQSILQMRTGIDSWENTKHVWLNMSDVARLRRVLSHQRLQPSARVGLWLLLKRLHAEFPIPPQQDAP